MAGGAQSIGALIVEFRANSAQFNAEMEKTRGGLKNVGEHATLSGRSLSRFAAIAGEQVFPALQGMRQVMEGVFQTVIRLGSGLGTIGLVAAGAAAIVGGALYLALNSTKSSALSAVEGVTSLDETIGKLGKSIESSIASLGRFDVASRVLKQIEATKQEGLLDIIPGGRALAEGFKAVTPFLDRFRGKAADSIKASRDLIRELEGAKLLEDPAAGPAGKIATQLREAAAKSFFELEKSVKSFALTAGEVAVTDPLEKMLIADFKRTQELIDKIRELPSSATTVEEAMQEIADKQRLIGLAGGAGGRNQIGIRDAASKAGAAGVATALGLGQSNLLTGFGDIEKLEKDIAGFRSEIERLTKLGVPARDLFDQIAEGQQKIDDQFGIFKSRFANSPALLAKVLGLEKDSGGGGLQRALDATVRGFNDLSTGSVQVQDAMGNLISDTTLAAEASNFLANVLNEDMPAAVDTASRSVVIMTDGVNRLAEAFARAREQAVFFEAVVGSGGNVAVAAPGNF